MTTEFRRRVGAAADVKELEYVSALHQTCLPELRSDGTISSSDVVLLLKSRARLYISSTEGRRIVRHLGGGQVDQSVIQTIVQEQQPGEEQQSSHNDDDSILRKLRQKRQRQQQQQPSPIPRRQNDHNNNNNNVIIMNRLRLAESIGTVRKKQQQQQQQQALQQKIDTNENDNHKVKEDVRSYKDLDKRDDSSRRVVNNVVVVTTATDDDDGTTTSSNRSISSSIASNPSDEDDDEEEQQSQEVILPPSSTTTIQPVLLPPRQPAAPPPLVLFRNTDYTDSSSSSGAASTTSIPSFEKSQPKEVDAAVVRNDVDVENPPPTPPTADDDGRRRDGTATITIQDDETKTEKGNEEYLDLVQIMGILLMPTLARAGNEWQEKQHAQGERRGQVSDDTLAEPEASTTRHYRHYDDDQHTTHAGRHRRPLKGLWNKAYDTWIVREEERLQQRTESLRPRPSNVISNVYEILLQSLNHHSCQYNNNDDNDSSTEVPSSSSSSSSFPIINTDMVRTLLILYGECERAADDRLVNKMVEAATIGTPTSSSSCKCGNNNPAVFNEDAFVRALTSDLGAWTVGCEDDDTTSFYDVWGYSNYHEKALAEVKMAQEQQQQADDAEIRLTQQQEEPTSFEVTQQQPHNDNDDDAVDATRNNTGRRDDDGVSSFSSKQLLVPFSDQHRGGNTTQDSRNNATDQAIIDFVEDAEEGGLNLATQVGTGGIKIAKHAERGGVKFVKGAETGGATEWKAEKKQWKDMAIRLKARLVPENKRHCQNSENVTAEDDAMDDTRNNNDDRRPVKHDRLDSTERQQRTSLRSDIVSDRTDDESTTVNETVYKVDHGRSLASIDSAIDLYSSALLMVGIYIFFICTSLVYATLFQQMPIFQPNCGDNFGCLLVDKIILWAIFALFLSLSGYLVIIPLSTGNNPTERSPFLNIAAVFIALVLTWIPYYVVKIYKERAVEEPYDQPEKTVTSGDYNGAQYVTTVVGCIVAGLIFFQFILAVIGNRRIRQSLLLKRFLLTSAARGSGRTKRAATRKINKLLENATDLQPKTTDTNSETNSLSVGEELMINFVIRGEAFEDCGGLIWTWKQLISGDLFEEEGVWIMARLLVIQLVQALFIGFKTYSLVVFIREALRRCQEWQDNLRTDLPDWVYDFVPTPQQASIALWPAFSVAVFISFCLFFVYLPSYVRRVIEFRCGLIPSLNSVHFLKYRKSMDLVYTNIGNALYAMFGASLLFFFFVALFIFLFIWPFSQDFMLTLLAWGLGLAITIGIKCIVESFWRRCFYAGFYRTRPLRANMTQLALECWYIGLGGGVLLARFAQFIFAACFFVGRTDVPFLSADVSMFGYIFDYAPQSFVKDLLIHEAHRHPYIERLLVMYMMKLKDNSFGSEAGSCWRQLFVVALMPWLMKHRVFSDERLGDYREEYNTRRREGQSQLQISQLASISSATRQPTLSSIQMDQVLVDASKSLIGTDSKPETSPLLPQEASRTADESM